MCRLWFLSQGKTFIFYTFKKMFLFLIFYLITGNNWRNEDLSAWNFRLQNFPAASKFYLGDVDSVTSKDDQFASSCVAFH